MTFQPSRPPETPRDLDAMLLRLHLPTVRRLYAELAERAEAEGMGYRLYLELLVAEEIAHRAETRLRRAVRTARFPVLKTIDDFNFTFQTALRRQMLGSAVSRSVGAPSSRPTSAPATRSAADSDRSAG